MYKYYMHNNMYIQQVTGPGATVNSIVASFTKIQNSLSDANCKCKLINYDYKLSLIIIN